MSAALLHPDDDLGEGTTLASGRFRIQGLIGFGASGVVYAATDAQSGDKVALKVLARPCVGMIDREARFEREARVGAAIAPHRNLVAIRDAGRLDPPDGRRFIVLEYVRGVTLGQLARRERLDGVALGAFARDLASGLQALHAGGVVHRDLKPSNVLVDRSGLPPVARITDFGLALEVGEHARAADEITTIDQRPGTPAYMAPEQFVGVRASFAADVYALGATLYELAAGEAPFSRVLPEEVQAAKLRGDPPGPHLSTLRSDLPVELIELVDACMHAEPAQRPDAATIVARLGGAPVAEPVASPAPAGRSLGLVLGVVGLGVVGLGAAWLAFAARTRGDVPSVVVSATDASERSSGSAEAESEVAMPEPLAQSVDVGVAVPKPAEDGDTGSSAETGVAAEVEPEPEVEAPVPKPIAKKPETSAKPSPAVKPTQDDPGRSREPDCSAVRADADRAFERSQWRELLEVTSSTRCWPNRVARARLRVRAYAELRVWSACIREGADFDDPQMKSTIDLCVRKAMEK